jgi:hypothetical protein
LRLCRIWKPSKQQCSLATCFTCYAKAPSEFNTDACTTPCEPSIVFVMFLDGPPALLPWI